MILLESLLGIVTFTFAFPVLYGHFPLYFLLESIGFRFAWIMSNHSLDPCSLTQTLSDMPFIIEEENER